jgi:hypothetical protein
LKLAAFRVLQWADPRFQYDRLAVTKNFTGSPHVDKDDVTFQYAVSLGDFGDLGGELVVESEDGAFRWEVDTRDRVARVDGRFVHWVRGYDSGKNGARYSVIFYANKPSAATERMRLPVDESFVPAGTMNANGDARGDGKRAGASPGAVGGTGGMSPRIATTLAKCFAAGLGIGMALRARRRTSARRE